MYTPQAPIGRGYESQFSANHLGTCLLWPALVRARRARVVALSSFGHRRHRVDLHDPNFLRRSYDPWIAYSHFFEKAQNGLADCVPEERANQSALRFRQLCEAHPISVSYRLKVQPAVGCETNNAQTIVKSGVADG
jgi:hypothetical protein